MVSVSAGDPLGDNRVFDELLGELGVLVCGDQPVEDVATEDVQDHVEVIEESAGGTVEFGDIPTPNLIGPSREQLRSLLRGMRALGPPVTRGTVSGEQPVHGRGRTEVDPPRRACARRPGRPPGRSARAR